ncbi:MAG: helix-turn-helix transcriptional regulator [bacterium]|nr:helix-turn-helix transcriptional regulator [bacterium]
MTETTESVLTFATWLRERRLHFELTMAELSGQLRVSPQFISLLESGRRYPSDKLVQRCAKKLEEDLNYLRFLAQRIPAKEKEALLRSPSAPEFLRRISYAEPNIEGSDDILMQKLLDGTGLLRPDNELASHYFTGEMSLQESRAQFQWSLVKNICKDRERFSANVVGWADFYDAFFMVDSGLAEPAREKFSGLHRRLLLETTEAYPLKLRFLVAFYFALLQGTGSRPKVQEAEGLLDEALRYANVAHNPDWQRWVSDIRTMLQRT